MICFILSLSISAFAVVDYQKVAHNILIHETKLVDLTDTKTKQESDNIAKDIQQIFERFLTERGQNYFSSNQSAQYGKVLLGLKEDFKNRLMNVAGKEGQSIDLQKVSIGHPQFDVLVKKFKGKNIQVFPFYGVLEFSSEFNPYRVASEFNFLNVLKYAEPNSMVGGINPKIARTSAGYEFTYGWGDCPSGCINKHTMIFQKRGHAYSIVGTRGPALPEDVLDSLFK
jgi:hypothetical protein